MLSLRIIGHISFLFLFTFTPLPLHASTIEQLPLPIYSIERGFFDNDFSLTLSTTRPTAEIRYTIDGSAPSPTIGNLYNTTIEITTTTTLRAITYSPENRFPPSEIATHSYLFLKDVIQQPAMPNGFPTIWAHSTNSNLDKATDYAMDDPSHWGGPQAMQEALLALPTLSLVGDVEDIFGKDGMYSNGGKGNNRPWESAASAEWIYPQTSENYQINLGLQSRSWGLRVTNKRSFQLKFKQEYGPKRLKYNVFQETPIHPNRTVGEFDRLILRAGLHDSYPFRSSCCSFPNQVTLTRDVAVRTAQMSLSGYGTYNDFVHLYINGLYWGIYNLTEKIDEAFLAEHFGGNEEAWFWRKADEQGGLDTGRYQALLDLIDATDRDFSGPEEYTEAIQYVDPAAFADYIILQNFFGVGDWPRKNWYFAMNNGPQPQPGFFLAWDAEVAWVDAWEGHPTAWYHPALQSPVDRSLPTKLWQSLIKNSEFRALFADRISQHLFNDGPLTNENSVALWNIVNNRIGIAIKAEQARWSDEPLRPSTQQPGQRYLYEDWQRNVAQVQNRIENNVERFSEAFEELLSMTSSTAPLNQAEGEIVDTERAIWLFLPIVR